MRNLILRLCPKLGKAYFTIMIVVIVLALTTMQAFAAEDTG